MQHTRKRRGAASDDDERAVWLTKFRPRTPDDDEQPDHVPLDLDDLERPLDLAEIGERIRNVVLHTANRSKDDESPPPQLAITLPRHVRRALQTLVAKVGGHKATMTRAGVWALSRGAERLERLPVARRACEAHIALLSLGGDIDDWKYQVAAGDAGTKRLYLRGPSPITLGRCATLGDGLGLTGSTIPALAIIAALVDTPLPGELPGELRRELREFHRRLHARANYLVELRAVRTRSAQVQPSRLMWADVFADGD